MLLRHTIVYLQNRGIYYYRHNDVTVAPSMPHDVIINPLLSLFFKAFVHMVLTQ